MDATGYVCAVAKPEIFEAKVDDEIEQVSDLSYFFGEGMGADSVHINPVQYPDRKVVERCAMIRDFGSDTEYVLEMWSHVKGDNLNSSLVVFIFAVFGALFVCMICRRYKAYQHKKNRHRRCKRR